MSNRAVARRYASALHAEADSADLIDRVDMDVELLRDATGTSRDLRMFLVSPIVSEEKKETVIRRLFSEHVSGLVLKFLLFVLRKGREPLLTDILDAYRSRRLEAQGIEEGTARVAVSMSEAEVENLLESISKTVGREVRLDVKEDPELIGGVLIKIGDRVYDGSLKRKLAVLRHQLQGGAGHVS